MLTIPQIDALVPSMAKRDAIIAYAVAGLAAAKRLGLTKAAGAYESARFTASLNIIPTVVNPSTDGIKAADRIADQERATKARAGGGAAAGPYITDTAPQADSGAGFDLGLGLSPTQLLMAGGAVVGILLLTKRKKR